MCLSLLLEVTSVRLDLHTAYSYIQLHKELWVINAAYSYIQVTYATYGHEKNMFHTDYIQITYGTYSLHTNYDKHIRSTYGLHADYIQVIYMTYRTHGLRTIYIQVTYGLHTAYMQITCGLHT